MNIFAANSFTRGYYHIIIIQTAQSEGKDIPVKITASFIRNRVPQALRQKGLNIKLFMFPVSSEQPLLCGFT